MTSTAVEEWKSANAGGLIDCCWGGRISREACRSYQSRTARYVLHFNGDHEPLCRANAEYVNCFLPKPCLYLISDDEAASVARERNTARKQREKIRRTRVIEAQQRNRLTDPEIMLAEPDFHRSLIAT